MRILFLSMLIGVVAGVIDILPMVLQKMDKRAIIAAFLQYFFISIIIVNINLPGVVWWLQGSLISLALVLPTIIIVSSKANKSAFIISLMSIILGALIGLAGHYLR